MSITFRTQLLGTMSDFSKACELTLATPEVLVDLIVRLSRYRAEGAELVPQVYLTDDIELLVRMLPDGESIFVSSSTPNSTGVSEMLKVCATLATEEWRVFCQQHEEEILNVDNHICTEATK